MPCARATLKWPSSWMTITPVSVARPASEDIADDQIEKDDPTPNFP